MTVSCCLLLGTTVGAGVGAGLGAATAQGGCALTSGGNNGIALGWTPRPAEPMYSRGS